jgi:hypothetical protein
MTAYNAETILAGALNGRHARTGDEGLPRGTYDQAGSVAAMADQGPSAPRRRL